MLEKFSAMIGGKGAAQDKRRLGDQLRDAGKFADAAEAYGAYVAECADDFAIWVQLGHARKEAGNLGGAYEAYARAKDLQPDDADLLLNFGRLLSRMGKNREAIDLLRRSHQIDANPHALNEIRKLIGELPPDSASSLLGMDLDARMRKVLVSGFFDPVWYLARYPDIDPNYIGPLQHFVEHGAFEWRSPGPNFDTEWYLFQNPDLISGLNSRTVNPLLHFLEFGAAEGRRPAPPTRTLVASAKSLLKNVYDIEPHFYTTEKFLNVATLPVYEPLRGSKSYAAFKRAFSQLKKPYDYVIAIPWMIHGGAELMALNMARAIVQEHGDRSVLVIAVDYYRRDAEEWLSPGIDLLMLQEQTERLTTTETIDALKYLIQALQPKCLINVNSLSCWELFRKYGIGLSQSMRIYGSAFCRDYNQHNYPAGYADTHVRDTIGCLTGLISDNSLFFEELSSHFGFPDVLKSKFITLYNPAPMFGRKRVIENDRFSVLWASRYTSQKNIGLLQKIASSAPDMSFDVWGRGEAEDQLREFSSKLTNFHVKGPYESFSALPLDQYDAFLYTSLWDGIPNVLLEAAGSHLPIVSSNVGGISELIDDETGWLIHNLNDPNAYVAALQEIRDNPSQVEIRQSALLERLSHQHSEASFLTSMRTAKIIERSE